MSLIDTRPASDETAVPASTTACVVLAAGKGSRMRSELPKALHCVGGRPMLLHLLDAATALDVDRVAVVAGHCAEAVTTAAKAALPEIFIAHQAEQRGTGHAVLQTREALEGVDGDVFILFVDTPLIQPETMASMAQRRRESGAGVVVLGFETPIPGRYGRLALDADGDLERIVEARDATEEELDITLCNSGVMCVDGARLFSWLERLTDENAASELYLTDIVALARADGVGCSVIVAPVEEVLGVNSRAELALVEAAFQVKARAAAMAGGATLIAPETVFLAHDTQIGRDVVVGPNVVFGPEVIIEDDAEIRAFCHLEGCRVASGATIGPFARLRPGAEIGAGARVGNFVEIKNAVLGEAAAVNHLSYVGDASVGDRSNIGAGTITCNYDGYAKHPTNIGKEVFVGSNSTLVAPLRVDDGAFIAAGSTVTSDAPEGALVVGRARQETKPGYGAALRRRLAATGGKKEG
ncbi:MAG: bifunctional UDP-N-acetylglucosamine diphosphorylase/glucosamine-1-phosphate N-acetyltransferase GlmU [Rhodobacteraceae bacterium]|nr:bifunctional UDP-N-acetylglucosamine diphosphorylase/glucosamine-1-phosphate N-acetyltransferase GlmU [Paracoccaceae bacterium]